MIDSGQLKVMKSLQEFLNSFSFPKGEASTLNLLFTAYSHLTLLERDLDVSGAVAASLPPLCNKLRMLTWKDAEHLHSQWHDELLSYP